MTCDETDSDATTDRLDPIWKAHICMSTYSTRLAGLHRSGHSQEGVQWVRTITSVMSRTKDRNEFIFHGHRLQIKNGENRNG